MKTRYKHIYFEEFGIGSEPQRTIYLCRNNKTSSVLGGVEYYPAWRKWVFEGKEDAVFDTSCLADIIDFMKQLNQSQRKGEEDGK